MTKFFEILLILALSTNLAKEPKPPYRFDKLIRPYQLVLEDNKPVKKTLYNMTEAELYALSISQKAKLLGMSKKNFKLFTKLVNREAGPKMEDKILVAAVVWNRKYCKQYPNKVKDVIMQPGQFRVKGSKTSTVYGNYKDKKAQLAILLACRKVRTNQIPHNVMNFNSISYRYSDMKRFKKYKHYNNYFVRDTRCKCTWCKSTN